MEVMQRGDLIPDGRLGGADADLLDHDAIARGVAEITLIAEAPVNIALFGAWGSGKSSVFSMIDAHLKRIRPGRVRLVRYDAWKYGGQELKRNFVFSLGRALGIDDEEFTKGLDNERVDTRLDVGGFLKRNGKSLGLGVGLAAGVAFVWVLVQALLMWLVGAWDFVPVAQTLLGSMGTVFGLALVAAVLGPKVLEGVTHTTRFAPPQGSDQFSRLFGDLVDKALTGKADRLVVFVDELDRCSPDAVVSTLIDLKTFLDEKRCVFIVAADREVIERSLREVPQAKPVREDEPYYSTPGAFLDKIFQHQLALPPLRPHALTQFAHDLVDAQPGLWQELREQHAPSRSEFDLTVFALVPAHVRSPRRVKVLLNNFATNARVAASRGIDWMDRAQEIAVLTVLQTEFPEVADDLQRAPRLLAYLRTDDPDEAPTPDLRELVRSHKEPVRTQSSQATPSGELLTDDGDEEAQEKAAGAAQKHLLAYLAKVAAANIDDPRPDLLYLKTAGGREFLPDPALGDLIDMASDTAPDEVVGAFEGQELQTLAIAIPLLVTEGERAFGPGQTFAYESACRLVPLLDESDRARVARKIAPQLVAAGTAHELSPAAVPGAVLAAHWAGRAPAVTDILGRYATGASAKFLDGLAVLVPHLEGNGQTALFTLLGDSFATRHEPLIAALRDAPSDRALALWAAVSDKVLDVLNADDEDGGDDVDAQTTRPAATQTARKARPAEPAVTTQVGLLTVIVEAVRSRPEHEALLSAVLATVQGEGSTPSLRSWVRDEGMVDIAGMSAALRRARHALLGLRFDIPDSQSAWADALPAPEAAPSGEAGRDLSEEVATAAHERLHALLERLPETPAERVDSLCDLAIKVHGWADLPTEDLTAAVSTALTDTEWAGAKVDGDASRATWTRKAGLGRIAHELSSDGDAALLQAFATDLVSPLTEQPLTEFFVEQWLDLTTELPTTTAAHLSAAMDDVEEIMADSDAVAFLRLQLRVRALAEQSAPAADRLLQLDLSGYELAVVDGWLALAPPAHEATRLLADVRGTPSALGAYCASLSAKDRTTVWLTLRDQRAEAAVLQAAGKEGLAANAVEAVANDIAKATPATTRKQLAEPLMECSPAQQDANDVKRAANDLALHLMSRETAGDFRTAMELLAWAGGAARGRTREVRAAIKDAPEAHRQALTQELTGQLVRLKLMDAPKAKGFLESRRRRR